MNTVFVLIMIFGGATSQSGFAVVQQEFSTAGRCEEARKTLESFHNNSVTIPLRVQACVPK